MTPLFDNVEMDSESSEMIDPSFVTFESHAFDSCTSPLDELEAIITNSSLLLSDRFQAFQRMYQSPYVDKQDRCIKMLLFKFLFPDLKNFILLN